MKRIGRIVTDLIVMALMGFAIAGCQKPDIAVESVALNKDSLSLTEGESATIVATVLPENASNKKLIWTTSKSGVATVNEGVITAVASGSATITATSDDGGKTATCIVMVKRACPAGAVDLGLSVFWASRNIGAGKSEEFGGYYQWAGLENATGTSIYDLNHCPYHTGGQANSGWTKYVTSKKSSYWSGSGSPDNKTVLDPADDIAHVKLGGKWRMPTVAEFNELIANCTSEWTTVNGVKGKKFTSKKSGYTDQWIFLPAAGVRDGTDVYDAGSYGYYWTSSLYTDYPYCAWLFYFSSDNVTESYFRYDGLSIRPVSE